MVDVVKASHESGASVCATQLRRRIAWILIVIADLGFAAWGVTAAAAP